METRLVFAPGDPAGGASSFGAFENSEAFHLLADAAPLQMWTARPDGALDYVNARVAEYFGRSRERVQGEGWQDFVHPADLKRVLERWKRSLETGEPYEVEFRLQKASNGLYRWHLGRAMPVRSKDGQIIQWVGSNADIDDHKRALEVRDAAVAVAERERERLRQVILSAPAVMAIYRGSRFEIVLVNRQWEQFTGRSGVVGKTIKEAFPEIENQGIIDLLEEVYHTGKPYQAHEMRVLLDRQGNGTLEETYWNFTLQRIPQTEGQGFDLLVHALEVTELISIRQELEQQS